MRTFARFATAAAVALALVHVPGCHHDDEPTVAEDGTLYEGGTNDEALAALREASAKDEATGPALTAPAPNAALPATPAPTFTWSAGATALRARPSTPAPFLAPAPFGAIRAAHAHGAPVNGRAYLLVLAGPTGTELAKVFTTQTSYTPDAATWERVRAGGATFTARVTGASFDNNLLVQSGGPVRGPATTFSVAK